MKMVAYGTAVGPFCTLICFCCIFGTECYSGGSNRSISVKTGGSVTIPCYYDKKYTQQRKFWYSNIDNSRIYTNFTNGTVSVIDYPAESLFLVTMRHVKRQSEGYGCYVEINEPSKNITTVIHEVHLNVKDAPDVSVMNSSVSGDEGGNISVQCLYSSKYKTRYKQWCRYKDKKCYTSQSSSVQIRDDGSGSFTVMMSGLMLSDSGWYFCSVGDLQAPVQLTVTPKTATAASVTVAGTSRSSTVTETTSAVPTDTNSTTVSIQYDDLKMWLLLNVLLLVLMVILVAMVTCILRKKQKRKNTQNTHNTRNKTSDAEVILSSVNPECDVTYSSVIKFSKTKACRPVCADDTVIYSSV